ncbi:flippase-like domain-containing protein [Hoyosella sp. YIM 151337]|uniref:lysylphosphatidylglycerol synthase transmembrane domain-containing protein n=1 Tax=Hoyosella sp. YIM 151337 TaxID=2992742 RepID=UPI0022359666|nr:lysylphosphatidylglycerol synthase transmembrane domain-containing protein [Hoyosella sp. YIM 151337]MCW4352226.1 flippase-like domain-containing protein [Hoyosella sp. YIM 151337]
MKVRVFLQVAVAVAILVLLVVQFGTGPFVAGFQAVSIPSIAIAATIGLATTVCSAWRWRLVADGLALKLPMRDAVAAYYKSQFLNIVLPAGVLGDVHRAVRHGLDVGTVPRAGRAVVEERVAGQLVLISLTVVALAVLPSPVPVAVLAIVSVVLVGLIAVVGRFGLVPRAWPGIVLASIAVVVGHAATFVLASHTVGVDVSMAHLLPLTLLVLVVAALPFNVGGWGPREGAAVWAFGAAGLGGAQGLAVSTAFGVFTIAAALPGAIMLLVPHRRPQRSGELLEGSSAHG